MTEPSDVLLFESSHMAHWAEDVALEAGIPVKIVPAPPEADDPCGTAVQVAADRLPELREELEREGIGFRTLPRGS